MMKDGGEHTDNKIPSILLLPADTETLSQSAENVMTGKDNNFCHSSFTIRYY